MLVPHQTGSAWRARYGLRYLSPLEYRTLAGVIEVVIAGPDEAISPGDVAQSMDRYLVRMRASRRYVYRLALFGIALSAAWRQLLALRVVLGLVAGGLPTVAYAATAGLVPAAQSGRTVGLASSAGLLGWAVAPFLVGLLVGAHPRAVFVMDVLLVFACAVALCWAGGRPRWYALPGFARAPGGRQSFAP